MLVYKSSFQSSVVLLLCLIINNFNKKLFNAPTHFSLCWYMFIMIISFPFTFCYIKAFMDTEEIIIYQICFLLWVYNFNIMSFLIQHYSICNLPILLWNKESFTMLNLRIYRNYWLKHILRKMHLEGVNSPVFLLTGKFNAQKTFKLQFCCRYILTIHTGENGAVETLPLLPVAYCCCCCCCCYCYY